MQSFRSLIRWLWAWAAHVRGQKGRNRRPQQRVAFLSAEPGCWPHYDAAPSGNVPAAARAGRGADPAPDNGPGAGRLVVGSIEPPELVSSMALRLPKGCFGVCRDGVVVFPSALSGARNFFLVWAPLAFFNSWRRAGDILIVDRALRNVSFSCFSITLAAEGNLLSVNPTGRQLGDRRSGHLTLLAVGLLL